ncbi:MAG: thioredoxin domain-containing protein [Pseudomonadota bacterium]|nr:thioredoxin domain-containing protein [Pseudomonadota bacterium]HJO34660.1 thioredoxin domain-containing protein [Gammaproteobacteria bacterium]
MPAKLHNRLADSASPYLRQHAANPVAWQPWDAAALEAAQSLQRPILLSIGYSTCHWCHVMAHESFEDPATAAVMNARFVNIKVDREQRPDLDRLYQQLHQLMRHRGGGWPLTAFLHPDSQVPFLIGTYFPPEPRHGLPAFSDLLQQVADFHAEHAEEIAAEKTAVQALLTRIEPQQQALPQHDLIARALADYRLQADRNHGGLAGAPKFPQAPLLRGLWALRTHDRQSAALVAEALAGMVHGGLFDQLGGGFFRYAVDATWTIPHFEKMLYDNAQLLPLLAEAGQDAAQQAAFSRAATLTAAWLARELSTSDGDFFAALDADTPAGEGAYYVWTPAQVEAALPSPAATAAIRAFGLDGPANFEGRWHLTYRQALESPPSEALEQARQALLQRRQQRPAPARDDKVLCSWNALTITGLTHAAARLQAPGLDALAAGAHRAVRARLWDGEKLSAGWAYGECQQERFLNDYAYLLEATLARLAAHWQDADLQFALALADQLLADFEDTTRGGFFQTPATHEPLLHRARPFEDEALPSGNGIAAIALLHLGHLLGESRYLDAAERTLAAAGSAMEAAPLAHATLLRALDHFLRPPPVVVVRVAPSEAAPWQRVLTEHGAPGYLIPPQATALPGALAARAPRQHAVAYLCRGLHCEAPTSTPEALAAALAAPVGDQPAGSAAPNASR